MALSILVTSPLPADLMTQFGWGETVTDYDSGAFQGSSPYIKPLSRFSATFTNYPRAKQSSLSAFYNSLRGPTTPFLMSDPYDNSVANVIVVATGTNPSSFWLITGQGYPVVAKSGSVLITSALSGALTQGTHYVINQDNGIIVASLRPSSADYWTATGAFYKKVRFVSYTQQSKLWEQFSGGFVIQEVALP